MFRTDDSRTGVASFLEHGPGKATFTGLQPPVGDPAAPGQSAQAMRPSVEGAGQVGVDGDDAGRDAVGAGAPIVISPA